MLETWAIVACFVIPLFLIASRLRDIAGALQEGNELFRSHAEENAFPIWVMGSDGTWRRATGDTIGGALTKVLEDGGKVVYGEDADD